MRVRHPNCGSKWTYILNTLENPKLWSSARRNRNIINMVAVKIINLSTQKIITSRTKNIDAQEVRYCFNFSIKIEWNQKNIYIQPQIAQTLKSILHSRILTLTPDNLSSFSMESITTISSPSWLIHTGSGVPQNLLLLTAQSLAPSSQLWNLFSCMNWLLTKE